MAVSEDMGLAKSTVVSRLWNSPYLLLALAALFWSGNFVVGRAVHDAIPPITLAFWRWIGALVLVLPFAWPHLRRDLPLLLRHCWTILVLAAFGISIFNTFIYIGLGSTTAINALLMQSAIPVAILFCSFCAFGDRARPMQVLGVAVSFIGVAIIAGRGSLAALLNLHLNPGDMWVLAAVLSYAIYSVLLRKRPPVHPLSFLIASFAAGAFLLLPAYAWETSSSTWELPSASALLAFGYLALFPSLLAYLFFNRGVELIGANRAGQFIHLMPVFGSMLAVVFLGEAFQLFHLGGLVFIALGITLATASKAS
jgi:drug/metabolite transporter (DMT)-like permease